MPEKTTAEKVLTKLMHPFRYDMGNDHMHTYHVTERTTFPSEDFPLGVTFKEECECGKTRKWGYMFDDFHKTDF